MSNALTLSDMSPALRKVVGRESPRATSAEEPDAGNPLVRIWRGAGMGNRPAYSTTAFSTTRVRTSVLPPAVLPLRPAPGISPPAQRARRVCPREPRASESHAPATLALSGFALRTCLELGERLQALRWEPGEQGRFGANAIRLEDKFKCLLLRFKRIQQRHYR